MLLERVSKVGGVVFVGVFDSEVIDGEAEDNGVGFMLEESRRSGGLVISFGLEAGDEGVAGDASCLGQSIHPFGDFNVNPSVGVEELFEVV